MRVIAIETEAGFVDQVGAEGVIPRQRHRTFVNVVCGGEIPVAGHGIGSPWRILAVDDVLAVAPENVLGVEVVIDANVERLGVLRHRLLELVVGRRHVQLPGSPLFATWLPNVGIGEKRDQLGSGGIDAAGG